MASTSPQTILSDLQSHPLSIIRLSESISSNPPPHRTSDISTANNNEDPSTTTPQPTPTSLTADLSHYRDLFSKLRFSYLEQVTKEKFLRAIVGDPPLIVDAAENVALETQLADIKAVLKLQKTDVAALVEELGVKGRELVGRYEALWVQGEVLGRLPREMAALRETVEGLRAGNEVLVGELGGDVGVEGVREAVRGLEGEREEVERRVIRLRREIPGRGREVERLEGEIKGLERERERAVEGAREAVRRRERGGVVGDELEMRGRWLSGCEEGLRGLLGVEA
ncbi:MAG: hypothetical protein L6R36_007921 [Xanthoria steineri]|nr:MAG: hypothetical protein L6R36_007921 [Xanthoria steineri]